MVKILDPTFKNAFNSDRSTLCWCWLITRVDGLMLGFTSLDVPFVIGGLTYQPYTGFDAGAAQQSGDLNRTDSQQLVGILDRSGIDKADLISGIYDYAYVRRFLVDYTNLPSSLSLNPPKHLELPAGYLAESKRNNLGYEIKVKDELSKLDNQIGTVTTKTCRANLGDDRCRVNLTLNSNNLTFNLAISEVESRRVFNIDGNFSGKYFDGGRLKFTSGLNQGLHFDIGFFVGRKIILSPIAAPFDVAVGDTVTAVAGCAKTKLACITRFRNFHNFVGEPDIPTTDLTIDTPTK
ncbi:MAG: hypothetical protein RLZZ535_3457 [Cyanobacteriota bacterium]|jgi:uncharacterized phage protein (TIGR02218 family)